jgi:hypothetical protein
LPWRGPIKVLAKQPATVALVADTPTVKVAKAPKVKAVKVAKAPKVQPVAEVALVNTTDIQVTPKTKPAKAPKVKTVKVAKAPKVKTAKVTHVDGTITFREDRQKYMAWHGGKAEAARPTLEAAKAYLFKKYGMADAQMLVLV